MGTWAHGNFSNDTALDWVYSLEEDPTPAYLSSTMAHVLEPGYLDSDVSAEGLAAVEVVAAMQGKPGKDFPADDLATLVTKIGAPSADLLTQARQAVERILLPEENELYDLWEEAGEKEAWLEIQHDLQRRLQA